MRAYHQMVFDSMVSGNVAVYTDPKWGSLLASTEKMSIATIVDGTTGTSPTLTVQVEQSPDNGTFIAKNGTAEINGAVLSTVAQTFVGGQDSGGNLGSGFNRLKITLGGTTPMAHVRIWVTGRGEQVSG